MVASCAFMVEMFSRVHFPGWTPASKAAFSAGRPKASQPMGWSTLKPRARLWRASTSPSAKLRTWPTWMRPDGYGNISST